MLRQIKAANSVISSAESLDSILGKLQYLSNPSRWKLTRKPAAIIVFGSRRLEVPEKVIELISSQQDWLDVPIIISGKGNGGLTEAELFEEVIRQGTIENIIYLDKTATTTADNVKNILSIINFDLKIPPTNLVSVNFPVLNRSSQRALVGAGITEFYSVVADIHNDPGKSQEETIWEMAGWINKHYNDQLLLDRDEELTALLESATNNDLALKGLPR